MDMTEYEVFNSILADGTSYTTLRHLGTENKPEKIRYEDKYLGGGGSEGGGGHIVPQTGDSIMYFLYGGAAGLTLILIIAAIRKRLSMGKVKVREY